MNKINISYELITSNNDINMNILRDKINGVIGSFINDNDDVYKDILYTTSINNNTSTSDGKFHIGDIYKITKQKNIDKSIYSYYMVIVDIDPKNKFGINYIHGYRSIEPVTTPGKFKDIFEIHLDKIEIDGIVFHKFPVGYNIDDGKINRHYCGASVIDFEFVKKADDSIMDKILLEYWENIKKENNKSYE